MRREFLFSFPTENISPRQVNSDRCREKLQGEAHRPDSEISVAGSHFPPLPP